MKLSIVIVAYKSGDILLKCLNSINKYNDLGNELEVIVVDNSPENERVDYVISESKLENVIYIPDNNRGFGAGNNTGAKIATGEVIGFVNPDIIFIEPVFERIYQSFNNKRLELLGCKLLYEDLTPGFSFYYDYNTILMRNWTIKFWNKINRFDSKKMFISGANLFVRKETFINIGMFDENIFMYYEEPELIRRIKEYNESAIILFNKEFRMIHLERKSTPSTPSMIGIAWDSAIYYGKKHNLDYRKKIRFEYKYYKMKTFILRILQNKQYGQYCDLITYLENNYKDYLK